MKDEKRMGTESIPKLMLQLSIPMIIAQLINVLYNMVDRMYIGRLEGVGALALTGLGLSFPILMIIAAFSSFAGAGGAPLAAIELGKGNRERAEKILGNAVFMILCFSVMLTVVFSVFKEPLLYMFGASDATLPFANDYLSIYLLGTIFVQIALGLNTYITCQGQAKTAMISVLIGAVTNIILDPILIFGMNMGVKGAALATIISQGVSAIWVLCFLFSSKSSIKIKLENLRPEGAILSRISALGISPFIMQATESLILIVFNSLLQKYGGDLYVGSMTILSSVIQLIIVPINGFSMGVQSIISFNYGAEKMDRVRQTIKYMLMVTFTAAAVLSLAAIFMPTVFASIFTNDAALIELLNKVMPVYLMGMVIFGIQMTAQCTFIGLGKASASLFVALLRKVILLIPLAYILSSQFGVMGVYYAEPIADVTSATVAGLLLLYIYRKQLLHTPNVDSSEELSTENN